MAKKRRRGKGKSTYFRNLYESNPSLLDGPNEALFDLYRKDHNLAADAVLPQNVKVALANAKMVSKNKLRGETGERNVKVKVAKAARGVKNFEIIEELIDNCISRVRALQLPDLDPVTALLIQARREVIWKMGQ